MPGGETDGASGGSSVASSSSGTASVALDVGCLEPFNPKGEPHFLSQRWNRWKRAFNLYVTGKGVSDNAQKRALFLHVAGMDVQEIYFTLAVDAESATFEATVKVLDDYFIPKSNVPFERHLFRQIVQEGGETVDQFVCRLRQRAINCEFGENENDYIRDQVIDKCCSSKLRRKFLEKEGALTLDDLLRIARSQEAVDRQLKQYGTDQVNNQLTDQVNAVGDKSGGNTRSGKGKKRFSCDQEGHFSGDKKCPARDRACRICGVIGHFKVKCPQARQRGGGDSGSRGDKGSKGADGGRRNTWSGRGSGRGRRGRGCGRSQETNLVADGNHGEEPTRPVQRSSPEFAFSVEQLTGHERQSSDLIALTVGGVAVPDVLIDSGATCIVMG